MKLGCNTWLGGRNAQVGFKTRVWGSKHSASSFENELGAPKRLVVAEDMCRGSQRVLGLENARRGLMTRLRVQKREWGSIMHVRASKTVGSGCRCTKMCSGARKGAKMGSGA